MWIMLTGLQMPLYKGLWKLY